MKLDLMRYALLSDAHSNLEAFDAVIADVKSYGVDRVLFLGDIVGYGPNPNECIDRLLKVADLSLGGNHDWAVVGKTPVDYFNPYAREAVDWTMEVLREDHKDFLKRTRAIDIFDNFQVAHSTPCLPEEWRYIMSQTEAMENYPCIQGDTCFIGHSHQPIVIEYETQTSVRVHRDSYKILDHDRKYIVNVGSVGQPRDGDVRACWVAYDSEVGSVEFRRVPYDVAAVQEKMRRIGLPRYLVDRIAVGR
ncbi:MAG: metallophosphoesterase family protein [Candidatus Nitrospinota bacterium M3_3B_026]